MPSASPSASLPSRKTLHIVFPELRLVAVLSQGVLHKPELRNIQGGQHNMFEALLLRQLGKGLARWNVLRCYQLIEAVELCNVKPLFDG